MNELTPHAPHAPDSPGLRLRALRLAIGLTQQALGDLAEIDRISINKIERGRLQASTYDVRERLAKGFGISVVELDDVMRGALTTEAAAARRHAA